MTKDIYVVSGHFPSEKRFGLTAQIRRCAVSIPYNIAEGTGRITEKDFLYYINIGLGSAYKLETQIILAFDLHYLEKEMFDDLSERIQEIQKMLFGLYKKISINMNIKS